MRSFLCVLAMGVAVLLVAGSVAWAFDPVYVEVPFDFMVRGKQMAAGRYEVMATDLQAEVLVVKNVKTGAVADATVMTRLADTEGKEATAVFDKAEGKYYLSELHVPGMDGFALPGAVGKHDHTKIKSEAKAEVKK
jgi:hypothetical protein